MGNVSNDQGNRDRSIWEQRVSPHKAVYKLRKGKQRCAIKWPLRVKCCSNYGIIDKLIESIS